jgi:hypothetical protein
VRHSFENTGEGIARLLVEAEPALQLRESIEDGVRLGETGMLTAGGKPRALQRLLIPLLAHFASSYREPASQSAS